MNKLPTRSCNIIYVQSPQGWKWRAIGADGKPAAVASEETYQLFYDCLSAARARGYTESPKCL